MAIQKNTPTPETEAKPAASPAATPKTKKATVAKTTTAAPAPAPAPAVPAIGKVSRKELALSIREKVVAAGKAVPLSIAEIMVLAYEEAVGEAMANMNEVVLPGFGKFIPVAKEAAEKRNPATNAMVTVPAHTAVRFKVGTKLKATANNGAAVDSADEGDE